jgi:hypothetical protein
MRGARGCIRVGFRRGFSVRVLLAALAVAFTVAPTAAASPSLTLTVQLVPATLSPGQRALAVVQLVNTGREPLSDVAVTLRLPTLLTALGAPGCKPVAGSAGVVTCSLGEVGSGSVARALVVAQVAAHVSRQRQVTADFLLRVGSGSSQPIASAASAQVLKSTSAAGAESCLRQPRTLKATLDAQTTALPSPPVAAPSLRLPCTPLAVGVLPKPATGGFDTRVSTVELPSLKRPATVVLTFPNETLPDEQLIDNLPPGAVPSLKNPDPLWVVSPTDPSLRRIVPLCPGGPKLPGGWQSCIVSVHSNDLDGGYDAGTITLLVRGSGFGDPRYVG